MTKLTLQIQNEKQVPRIYKLPKTNIMNTIFTTRFEYTLSVKKYCNKPCGILGIYCESAQHFYKNLRYSQLFDDKNYLSQLFTINYCISMVYNNRK